jgi:hypothetical protein
MSDSIKIINPNKVVYEGSVTVYVNPFGTKQTIHPNQSPNVVAYSGVWNSRFLDINYYMKRTSGGSGPISYSSPFTESSDSSNLITIIAASGLTSLNSTNGELTLDVSISLSGYDSPWTEVGNIPHVSNWNVSGFTSPQYDANGKVYLQFIDAGDGDLVIRGYGSAGGGNQSFNNLINGAGTKSLVGWGTVDFDGVPFTLAVDSSRYLQGTPSYSITINAYKEASKTNLVAKYTGTLNGTSLTATPQNDSGLSLTLQVDAAGTDSSITVQGTQI